jgi:signal transduction histidine kinase
MKEELLGSNVFNLVVENERKHAIELMRELLSRGIMHGIELNLLRSDGSQFLAEAAASVLLDQSGKPSGLVVIAKDITERKRAEEEIKLKNEQLIKLNSEKDTFFSIIAHDLKSPFQGFLGLTEIMAEEASSFSAEELTRFSNEMYKTATNLYSLLKNLLEWSQMQKGLMSFQPKEFSISDMIAENVETIKIRSEQKGITVINAVTEPFDAYADENMINSVLLNLLSNAVKFTNRNGTVTVKANKVVDQMIEISISDTGTGMQKSVVEKLFKVGEKIGSKGTDGELSTGLGLLLCNEFIEKHGGRIWIQSELGAGSTFSFSLPDMRQ